MCITVVPADTLITDEFVSTMLARLAKKSKTVKGTVVLMPNGKMVTTRTWDIAKGLAATAFKESGYGLVAKAGTVKAIVINHPENSNGQKSITVPDGQRLCVEGDDCPNCKGTGWWAQPVDSADGGVFQTASGFKYSGQKCWACDRTGKFNPNWYYKGWPEGKPTTAI